MKKLFALVLFSLSVLVCAQEANAKFELGVIVGEPTGLSFKTYINSRNAVDLAAAWSYSGADRLSLHGDYLWFNYKAFDTKEAARTPLYYGIGARLKFEDQSSIGVRFPLGIQFFLKNASPLTVFMEAAPILELAPDTELELSAAFGLRFIFDTK